MRNVVRIAIALTLFAATGTVPSAAKPVFPGATWEKVDPVASGCSRPKLAAARRYARDIRSTAVIIVQDGRIIASWGDVAKKVEIH